MKQFIFALFCFFAKTMHAHECLTINESAIHTVASFKEIDYFLTYSHAGEFLWEVPFSSQIVSWGQDEGLLLIFSKTRDEGAFFLSCIEPDTGKVKWEKVILGPRPTAQTNESAE